MTKRRSPGDGSVYQRASDGLYIGAVVLPTTDGRMHRKTVSAKTKRACLDKLREVQTKIANGTLPTAPKMTVEQWLTHWLDDICKPRVRPKTFNYYRDGVKLHLIPHIGTIRVAALTQADVRGLHRTVQAYSSRCAVQAHQVLQKALKDAEREGYVARNVAALTDKPKHVAADRGALTADTARHLIKIAIERGDPLATRWAAAFLTGARPGELLGLTWDRVDLEAGTIDLSWQLQEFKKVHGCATSNESQDSVDFDFPCGKRASWCPQARWDFPAGFEFVPCHRTLVWTRPKTHAGKRAVPIAAPLLALLRAHAETYQSDTNPHQLVWHRPDGRPFAPKDDREAWAEACVAAGLAKRKAPPAKGWETPPPALYVARHTTATLLMAAGVPEQTRMRIMGQSSVEAHRGYVHVDQTLTRAAVAELDGLLTADSP